MVERNDFRKKHGGTLARTIEETYGINLNIRGDAKLKNLLEERGFDSQTQLIDAYHQRLTSHARKRTIFPSFHGDDIAQVGGFRLMVSNPNVNLDLDEEALLTLVKSKNMPYIKQELTKKIRASEILVCLIGNGTAWRDMVEWEIEKAMEIGNGICGVKLKESRGQIPKLIKENGFPVASWDVKEIVSVIEAAAARRS